MKSEILTTTCVSNGKATQVSINAAVTFGTTNVIKNIVTHTVIVIRIAG
jgi:hypothetical protein